MRFSAAFVALAAPYLAMAAPVKRMDATAMLVLKFADVLEQFESGFYTQALSKFQASDFINAGYADPNVPVEQFTIIQADEATHSTVLQSAIRSSGDEPITSCRFNFDAGLTDVATMAATARVVENVGVGAYLGGATLISDPQTLVAAGSILTVEARHQTILNILSGSGTAVPSAFDIALKPEEVLAMVVPFIDTSSPCDVGIQANPTLTITNTGRVGPGTQLTFQSSAITGSTDGMFCQMLVGGVEHSIALPLNECVVPDGINGPVAIWVTSDGQPLLSSVTDRATTQLVAGPTFVFIDTQPQAIGQSARSGSSGASPAEGTTTETRTISPEEASSIISGASPTDVPAGSDPAAPSPVTTDSSAAPTATDASGAPAGNASTAPTATANEQTGPTQNGAITINGWSMVDPASGN